MIMKRLCLFIILLALPIVALADFVFEVDGICYSAVSSNSVYVKSKTGGEKYEGEIVIPDVVNYESVDYKVVGVSYEAFAGCQITSVTIGDNVQTIGNSAFKSSTINKLILGSSVQTIDNYAFQSCQKLTAVSIPNSVTYIGVGAFENCKKLSSIELSNSVKTILNSVFFGCNDLISVKIPSSVTSIELEAFSNCRNLTSVILSENLIRIGVAAFAYCSSLSSIDIPESVKEIDKNAFCGCAALTSLMLPDGVELLGSCAFASCSSLVDVDLGLGLERIGDSAFQECESITSIIIPNSVKDIGDQAFYDCKGLKTLTVGTSLTSIGKKVFSGCNNITSITYHCETISFSAGGSSLKDIIMGDEVKFIGRAAFAGLSSLTSITIGKNVESIGREAFSNCSSLSTVEMSNNVTSIGDAAFGGCESITIINIPNSVTSIGNSAFSGCSSLKSMVIPKSVLTIGNSVFSRCINLSSIIVEEGNSKYDSRVSCNAIIEKETNKLIAGCKNSSIPDNVTAIGDGAFYMCGGLTTITIPSSITAIEERSFAGCDNLISIFFNEGLSTIGESAFQNCVGLLSITLPNSLISIGSQAFYGCNRVKNITIGKGILTLYYKAFGACNSLMEFTCYANEVPTTADVFDKNIITEATLLVPELSIEKYKQSAPWSYFKSIKNIEVLYTLLYMVDNDMYKSYQLKSGETITPEPAPTKDGYTFSGWSEIPETMPAKDVTITGSFTINKYKLVYMVDGVEYKSYEVEFGTAITPEAEPTKEYYTFSGWSEIPETMPAKDVTVTGTFSINKYKLVYKVDGEEYKSFDIEYGASITPEPAPTKEGYTFSGWSTIPETMPAEDVIVTGTFAVNKYKLVYKVDGAEYKSYEIEYGKAITAEPVPSKEGYTFSGWSDIPETMPAKDVTITGSFSINKYKLVYKVDGEEYKSYDVEYGAAITAETAPTKEGFEFSGWSDIPETMPANDVTVTGTFKAIVKADDGTIEVSGGEASVTGGETATGDVDIPESVSVNGVSYPVTTISDGAYQNNANITSATIPESVTTIGANAFNGCSNLGEVNVGKSVSNIGSKAFANLSAPAAARRAKTRGASGLVIKCYATSVPTTAADAFENTSIGNATLLVDDNSVAAYKSASPWSGFGTIMGFSEATGINGVWFDNYKGAKIFSIDGKPLNNPQKGINIIRMDNGKTKKVVVK